MTGPHTPTARPHATIIAHRGASGLAPENTPAAFLTALALGADTIEIDVHLSRDGHVVVIHDDTVDRTTTGTGEVRTLGLAEIQSLDAGSWFYGTDVQPRWSPDLLQVPTLEQVIEMVRGKASLLIELKDPTLYEGLEERLVESLRSTGLMREPGAVTVQSFDETAVRKMAQLAPEVPRFQLTSGAELSAESLDGIRGYADGVAPNREDVTALLISEAHARGLSVYSWTVNRREDMQSLWRMGLDGIITDNVVELRRVLEARVAAVPGRRGLQPESDGGIPN